jgi:hypothetical protein
MGDILSNKCVHFTGFLHTTYNFLVGFQRIFVSQALQCVYISLKMLGIIVNMIPSERQAYQSSDSTLENSGPAAASENT